ncbi:hypothetical protein [Xanthovirga aplysinae]|uniref:hypothetical protein n=1 Tax=Xanthovirga aplysinae TaxID=2529853 RepID=UPI0012BD2C53|nr:hypothetical protein [Xanthovirga aplysinae]MTI31854.1 hypothetical protein [Xanthovirga aplysinae]
MWRSLASLYANLSFLPVWWETIVLPQQADEIKYRIWRVTKSVRPELKWPNVQEKSFLFNGWIEDKHFRISRILTYPNNYIPLIIGEIEETSTGCIVFLKYKLFFFTRFFLIFWTIVTLLLSLFFLLFIRNNLYAFLSILTGGFNYLIVIINFNIQIDKSRKVLHKLFS